MSVAPAQLLSGVVRATGRRALLLSGVARATGHSDLHKV